MILSILIFITIIFFSIIKWGLNDRTSRFFGYSFLFYWFGSLIISTFRPFGLYQISDFTYCLLILGGSSFLFGMVFPGNKRIVENNKEDMASKFSDKIMSNKYVMAFLLVLTLYLMSHLGSAMFYSQVYGGAARVNLSDEVFSNDKLFVYVYNYIGFVCFHFFNFIFWESVMQFHKKYIINIFLVLVYLLTFGLLNGGRNVAMITFLYMMFLFMYNHKFSLKINLRSLIIIIAGSIITLYAISSITSYRKYGSYEMSAQETSEGMEESEERVISYSTLPFVLLDRAIQKDYYSTLEAPYFGRATFSGIDEITHFFLRYLINYERTSEKIVKYVQDNSYPVSTIREANYAYTGLLYHYLDFGVIGIVIFPLLFGIILRCIIHSFNKDKNLYLLILLAFCYYMMLHSVFTCYFIKSWVLFYITLLMYLAKRLTARTKKIVL